jgi:hypothetical protein
VAWTADHRGSTPPKSFFESLPRELEEAAQIDGLGWFGIFVRIVLPLSKAVLATMRYEVSDLYSHRENVVKLTDELVVVELDEPFSAAALVLTHIE